MTLDIVPTIGAPSRLTRLDAYLDHYMAIVPTRDAAVFGEQRWSYTIMRQEVDRYARALLASGVHPGDRVATLSYSHALTWIQALATTSIGAIWLGLNPKYTATELAWPLEDAAPTLLLSAGSAAPKLASLADSPTMPTQISTAADLETFLSRGAALDPARLTAARAAAGGQQPAAIVYTSGSTGRPKGALISHQSLIDCALVQAGRWFDFVPTCVNDLPINHIGWLGDICCSALIAGGTLHFREHFDPAATLRLIEQERLTVWGGVPTMFLFAVQTPEFQSCDLSSLRRIIWEGAAMPSDLVGLLALRGVPIATGFSMTETVGLVTYSDDGDDITTLATTIGRVDPHYAVRLMGADGALVGQDQPGEIQVHATTNFLGYWCNPDATVAAFTSDGWLRTGDLAVQRADGRLQLVGRSTEQFKSGGYNVYPLEVEQALEAHPAVLAATVIGVPDTTYGEVGYAFVMPMPGTTLHAEELNVFLRERLANYKLPKQIFFEPMLPMLPIGKIDRVALRKRAHALAAAASA
jgi:acyl-CoA synthetase (AMP-forming)/AMP-acid ligase II